MVKPDSSLQQTLSQFQVVGRLKPTESHPESPIYRMRIFAKNRVIACSRFWYFMKRLKKVKKNNGEILDVNVLHEKKRTKIKNFGIWLRYQSRTGTHNMYKEVRDIEQTSAISQIYAEMAGRHRAQSCSIQIIRIAEIPASMCKRPAITSMHNNKLKIPQIRPVKAIKPKKSNPFSARRPTLYRK